MRFLFKIILLLSQIPLRILYLISDFMFFVIYYIIGYRRKVVLENLQHSFPEKSPADLKKIEKKFYINFCDYIVETFKSFTISSTELRVRVQHLNQDIFQEAKEENNKLYNVKVAAFPFIRKIEDYDFSFQPTVNEEKIKAICNSDFYLDATNIVFILNHCLSL